jgi:hypothetical protein
VARKRLPERDLPLTNLEGIAAVLRPAETIRAEEALLPPEQRVLSPASPAAPAASVPEPHQRDAGDASGPPTIERTDVRAYVRTDVREDVYPDVRAYVREGARERGRTQVRNAFNVWEDQLRSLAEIQAYRYRTTGKKPQLSHLVQEALDAYIAQWRTRMEERAGGP